MRLLTAAATLTLVFVLPLSATAQAPATQTTPSSATSTTTKPATSTHPAHHTIPAKAHHSTHHTTAHHTSTHHNAAKKTIATKPSTSKPAPPALHIAEAPPAPAPFSQNPILQLQGNAGALILFAPDTHNSTLRQQMALLHGHDLELSKRNTVFVPVITHRTSAEEVAFGENIDPGTYPDQLSARQHFGIHADDFAVVLIDKDGTERFRSVTPVPITTIETTIDAENPPPATVNK